MLNDGFKQHKRVLDLIPLILSTDNSSAKRFYGMGFKWHKVEIYDIDIPFHIEIRGSFECVCKRTEYLTQVVSEEAVVNGHVNIYRILDSFHAMSREHLLDDGYTVEQVDAMEARLRNLGEGKHNGN